MYSYDFVYDGKRLSDFGFMVCSFDDGGSAQTAGRGADVTLVAASTHNGKKVFVSGIQYENMLETTFQICKDPDVFDQEHMEITPREFRDLSRWLGRTEFCWFRNFDWDEPEKEHPWFHATFTLSKIEIAQHVYGVELEMFTDSPFGYGDEETKELVFAAGNLSKKFIDKNDDIGESYPAVKITCKAAGTLTISDDVTGCSCEVKNCANGEVISFSGDTMIVSTSSTTHDIANDFNYDYFRIGNTLDNKENVITVSIPCTVEITYRPIWKDTL